MAFSLRKSFFSQGILRPSHYRFGKNVILAHGQIFFVHFQVQKLYPVISHQCQDTLSEHGTQLLLL